MENNKLPEESQDILAAEFPAEPAAVPTAEEEAAFVPMPVEETAPAVPVEEAAAPSPSQGVDMDATQVFRPEEFTAAQEAIFRASQPEQEIDVDYHAISDHQLSHHGEDFLFFEEETKPDAPFREVGTSEEFQRMWNAAPDEYRDDTAPDRPQRPVRKGRPKRKKGYGLFGIPHLIATVVWLAIIVAVGVSMGRMLWVCASDVLAFGREDRAVTVTIASSDTIEDIARKLHNAGLVRYPGLFELYAGLAVDEGEIASGTFELNTLYDYHAIVNGMSAYSSFRSVVEDVVIPEGYSCRQIFALLEEKGICTVAELEAYAANGEFKDFWFLEGVERGDKYCLEGFLFPDTYDFYEGSTPREALGKMLLGFEARFSEEMRAMLPALNERLAAKMRNNGCSQEFINNNQIGIYELLIVASLIEEETAGDDESKNIASVIYNRLTQDQSYERYLGIDATILYALGEHKDALSKEDLEIDSPYNTRTHAGLVPTPITNPGLNSIMAALDFADTDYYYYVLNPATGRHQFSKTLEEHEQWRQKFAEAVG